MMFHLAIEVNFVFAVREPSHTNFSGVAKIELWATCPSFLRVAFMVVSSFSCCGAFPFRVPTRMLEVFFFFPSRSKSCFSPTAEGFGSSALVKVSERSSSKSHSAQAQGSQVPRPPKDHKKVPKFLRLSSQGSQDSVFLLPVCRAACLAACAGLRPFHDAIPVFSKVRKVLKVLKARAPNKYNLTDFSFESFQDARVQKMSN